MLSKALFLLGFVLEVNKVIHLWKSKKVRNSFQDQDCTDKTNNCDDRLPREAKS